jgi:hypothetical protein
MNKLNKLNSGLLSSQTATCIYRGAARAPKLDRNGPAHVCSSQGTKQCKINIKELHIVLSGQIIATLSSEDYLLLIARVL